MYIKTSLKGDWIKIMINRSTDGRRLSDEDAQEGRSSDAVNGDKVVENDDYAFTQGVGGDDSISSLTPAQEGKAAL